MSAFAGAADPTLIEPLSVRRRPRPRGTRRVPARRSSGRYSSPRRCWWRCSGSGGGKVSARIQSRFGPNRVGPIGLLQSLADGIKLILKEDLVPATPTACSSASPYLAFAPAFAAFVALPFGPELTFEPRLNVGVFWILAMLSVEVMGVILAGWSSNNKWAVYGAMREACQVVSYEIPLGLSILVGVMTAGTLNLVDLGHLQGGGVHTWLIVRNPFVLAAFFVFFIASLASNKRAVRPAGIGVGTRGRLPHRVQRAAVLVLLLRRVRRDVRHRRHPDRGCSSAGGTTRSASSASTITASLPRATTPACSC